MDNPLASDALVVAVDLCGEEQPPLVVCPEGRCAYCADRVQMVNARFRNTLDGRLHTCDLWRVKALGRRYVRGEFTLLTPTPQAPAGEPEGGRDA